MLLSLLLGVAGLKRRRNGVAHSLLVLLLRLLLLLVELEGRGLL